MSFLNPLALWGLLFIAVPIALLLFLNRRKLILYWAAYEWMLNVVVKNRQKSQLDDLLKLISKILLLLAISLIVSRPFIKTKGTGGKEMIIIDNSPSMETLYDNKTRLQKSIELAKEMIAKHDGQVALYTFGSSLEPLVSDFTSDKGILSERLNTVELSPSYAGVKTLATQLPKTRAAADASRITFIGDFQNCWYGDTSIVSSEMNKLGKAYPMTWVEIDVRENLENCSINNMAISPEGLFAGRQCFLTVDISNNSDSPSTDRTLTLKVNGQEVSKTAHRFGPNERKTIPLTAVFKNGLSDVSVELDSDLLKSDNSRHAVVKTPPTLRILAVTPVVSEPDIFPYDVYFKSAVISVFPKGAVDYKSISPLELETMNTENYDIIVVFNLTLTEKSSISQKILSHLERGGGVLAFLPVKSSDDASAFGVKATLMPDAGKLNGKMLKDTLFDFMSDPDLKPESISIKKSLIFEAKTNSNARIITEKGISAISKDIGKGRIILFGFMPYQGYTDMIFNPNFVQFTLRTLWEARQWDGYFSDNGTISEWHGENMNSEANYTLVAPDGSTRSLTKDGVGNKFKLLLPQTLPPGIYKILEDGKEIARFGHNTDTGDSAICPVNAKPIEDAKIPGLTITPAANINKGFGRINLGWFTVFLLLTAIAFEAYAHFFRKKINAKNT